MDNREKDIQELCRQVLEVSSEVTYLGGWDKSYCHFCGVMVRQEEYDLSKLPHKSSCAYLIAKDLSTNMKEYNLKRNEV